MGKGRNKLPDRWLDYSFFGQPLSGLKIFPCKVPLRKEIVQDLGRHEWFTPDLLLARVTNIGCIVDLTDTDRYYDPTDFTEQGIRYEKIRCVGKFVPSQSTINRFFEVVEGFLQSEQSQGKVLMVHCTHGVNRTGYLVSRYLIERLGYTPSNAIEMFNQARGHAIEKYLDELRRLSPPQQKRRMEGQKEDSGTRKRPRVEDRTDSVSNAYLAEDSTLDSAVGRRSGFRVGNGHRGSRGDGRRIDAQPREAGNYRSDHRGGPSGKGLRKSSPVTGSRLGGSGKFASREGGHGRFQIRNKSDRTENGRVRGGGSSQGDGSFGAHRLAGRTNGGKGGGGHAYQDSNNNRLGIRGEPGSVRVGSSSMRDGEDCGIEDTRRRNGPSSDRDGERRSKVNRRRDGPLPGRAEDSGIGDDRQRGGPLQGGGEDRRSEGTRRGGGHRGARGSK